MDKSRMISYPIVDEKEIAALDALTLQYEKLISPGKIARIGTKVGELIPSSMKQIAKDISSNITEQELFKQMMEYAGQGFKKLEEQAAKFTISPAQILQKANRLSSFEMQTIDELCTMRSYELSKLVDSYKNKDTIFAVIEGGGTGALGFWGLPFNIVLSTFLYYRAVQSIAMFYGYDVKNDSAELVIATEVFTQSLNPTQEGMSDEKIQIIGKLMLMGKAAVIRQTSKKTWTDMASRGGITLLLTQMRALAHNSAQKALQKAGQKGLENNLFREIFEQIGRKLALRSIGKAVPVASAIMGALIDTSQMSKVLDYADIFYHKRFIMEKERRVHRLINTQQTIRKAEIVDMDFEEVLSEE